VYDPHGLLHKATQRAWQDARAEQCYATAYQALAGGQDTDARRLFGILATMMPRDERPWIGLAVCHERRANWTMAAAMYGMGSALARDSGWSYFGRGRALKRLGKRAAALQAFQAAEAVTTDPALLSAIEEESSQP
jgi:tetratricopeptide (TPR) repeat protein